MVREQICLKSDSLGDSALKSLVLLLALLVPFVLVMLSGLVWWVVGGGDGVGRIYIYRGPK